MNRLHPVSGVQRSLGSAVQGGTAGFFLGFLLTGPLAVAPFWISFALAAIGGVAGLLHGVARYLRFTYGVEGDTLAVSSGVFNRQERAIPLGRVQNVDVSRSVFHRLLGLAVVRFETAGGSATEAVLDAVTLAEARRLQDRLGTHEFDDGPARGAESAEEAPPAPETRPGGPEAEVLYELDLSTLLTLGAVSAMPAAPFLVVVSTPVLGDLALAVISASSAALGGPATVTIERLFTFSARELAVVVTVALVEFAVATWFVSAAMTVVRYYDFRLSRVGDELRYERGLLSRYSGSIPTGKIQTTTVRETVLMRPLGSAALSVETAGYGPGSSDARDANTAIPLADRETVKSFAESFGEYETAPVKRPPTRARRRYVVRYALVILGLTAALAAVDATVFAIGPWYAPLAVLPLAAVAGHWKWCNRGHALADDAFIARSGFWRRSTRAVPYYRLQTVVGTRTLFQRYRDLASVTADTASTSSLIGGDATAHDVDGETATQVHEVLRDRLADHIRRRRDAGAGD